MYIRTKDGVDMKAEEKYIISLKRLIEWLKWDKQSKNTINEFARIIRG